MSRLVNVPPQKVWGSVPLELPLIKMSDAEAIWLHGQPQIYDKNYPLDYSGLNFSPPWWADTGVGGGLSGGVGGGNVGLLPHEMSGFGSLGLTPAQQAARAAAQAKAQAAAAARQAAASTAKANAAAKAATAKQAASDRQAANKAKAADAAAARQTAQAAAKQAATDKAAANKAAAADKKAQADCKRTKGTWANGVCTPGAAAMDPAQAACLATTPPGTWANGICTPPPGISNPQAPQSCSAGMTWDAVQMQCLPGIPQPTAPIDPSTGLPVSTPLSTNSPTSNPAIMQCQQSGGSWNGTYCVPAQQAGGGGGGGAMPPPPMGPNTGGQPDVSAIPPGFDAGGGGDGASMQMSSPGGGPGPQLNDQAFSIPAGDDGGGYDPSQDPSQYGQTTDQTDTGSKDDTSKVADTNVFESISKLFSGMGGMGEGLNAAPTWFGMGKGGNAPPLSMVQGPKFYSAPRVEPVNPSTTTAVVGAAVVLMVGAAAIYLHSKGKRK